MDLFRPCTKENVETYTGWKHIKSNIEGHGGTTRLIRTDRLSLAVGCASTKENNVTILCSSMSDCDSSTTFSAVTYTNCEANDKVLHNK